MPPEVGVTPSAVPRRNRQSVALRDDLTLRQQVWLLAKWPLLEQFMAFFVGLVDTALAGRLPTEAVHATNAMGVAAYVMWLMGLFQGAVGVGALALISRAVGARHRREANAALGQSLTIAVIWGSIMATVFVIIAPVFGWVFGLEPRAHEMSTLYLRLLAAMIPFMAILFVGSACLRGAGDTRSPFMVMGVVNIVNITVSLLLVIGPAPIGGHGVAGIAIGTMAAWAVGAFLMIALLLRGRGGLKLHLHRLRPHKRMTHRIIRISWPNLAESLMFWIGNAVVVYVVGHLPQANAMGAHVIAIRIEALSFLPGFAFGQAAATMAGQYLGAGNPQGAKKAVWVCWSYGAAVMSSLGILFILIPQPFVWVMTDQPTFLDQAPTLLVICGFAQIGFGTAMILAGALRGAGDTRTTMLLNFASTYIVRLPLVWFMGVTLEWGLVGVWIALSLELTVRGLLFLARFLHGGWQHVKV
ncbi:MAG: MATE family efflux transporter [Phycisphaeraceae bacterium]